jgi:hypothetical protein
VFISFHYIYPRLRTKSVLWIRKKYPQNLPGEESEQIESHEETVAKDDLPNESMKTDKAMEFDSNKEISDNVGVDNEAQNSK